MEWRLLLHEIISADFILANMDKDFTALDFESWNYYYNRKGNSYWEMKKWNSFGWLSLKFC